MEQLIFGIDNDVLLIGISLLVFILTLICSCNFYQGNNYNETFRIEIKEEKDIDSNKLF